MPFNIGGSELIIVLVIIFVIFGVGRLPEVGGAIGKGLREFRRSQKEDGDDFSDSQQSPGGETTKH